MKVVSSVKRVRFAVRGFAPFWLIVSAAALEACADSSSTILVPSAGAPVIDTTAGVASRSASYAERATLDSSIVIFEVVANDPDGDNTDVMYEIVSQEHGYDGGDSSVNLFQIDSAGVISFVGTPVSFDYEAPAGLDSETFSLLTSPQKIAINTYTITVVAKNSEGNSEEVTYTVIITDANDPAVALPNPVVSQLSIMPPAAGATSSGDVSVKQLLMAFADEDSNPSFNQPDISISAITFNFDDIPTGVSLSYMKKGATATDPAVETAIDATNSMVTISDIVNGVDGQITITVTAAATPDTVTLSYSVVDDSSVVPGGKLNFNINNLPEITSMPGDITIAENTDDTLYDVDATDADPDQTQTLSYSLSGVDAGFFDISPAGVITFKSAPDFEAPRDDPDSTNNVYSFAVVVTDTLGGTAMQDVTIQVTDVDEVPTGITFAPASASGVTGTGGVYTIAEDLAPVTVVGGVDGTSYYLIGDINVDDPDAAIVPDNGFLNNVLTVSDTANFSIVGDKLYLTTAPNFEPTPSSYPLTITTGTGTGAVSVAITLGVTDANDAPQFTPDVASVTFNKYSQPGVLYPATANDEDGDDLTYEITSAVDAANADYKSSFVVDSSGRLSFDPDAIANGQVSLADGAYEVVITASDGRLTGAITVDVRVISEPLYSVPGQIDPPDTSNEPAVTRDILISDLTGIFGATFSAAVTTLTFSAPPIGVTLSYDDGAGVDTPIGTEFTIGTVTKIKISVASTAAVGLGEISFIASDGITNVGAILGFDINNPPEITPASVDVTIGENNVDTYTVVATDIDTATGQTLRYSLSVGGDAQFFSIDENTGVITFKSAPDFENPMDGTAGDRDNVYSFTATVSDGSGGTATQDVSIEVTDVDERPTDITITAIDGGAALAGNVFTIVENSDAVPVALSDGTIEQYYLIGAVGVTDLDAAGSDNLLSVTGTDGNSFYISTDNKLYLTAAPNFEIKSSYLFTITANASDVDLIFTSPIIALGLTNVNDAPQFTEATASRKIFVKSSAQSDVDAALYTARASDDDGHDFTYDIDSVTDYDGSTTDSAGALYSSSFAVVASSDGSSVALSFSDTAIIDGQVSLASGNVYTVVISATETQTTTTPLRSTVTVMVEIVGNYDPRITSVPDGNIMVPENTDGTTVLYDAKATDTDPGQTLTYSIFDIYDARFFNINPDNGEVTFRSGDGAFSPDFEVPRAMFNVYSFIVEVEDDGGGSVVQIVSIEVTDVNEAPTVTLTAAADPNAGVTVSGAGFAIAEDAPAVDVTLADGTTVQYYLIGDIIVDDPDAVTDPDNGFRNNVLSLTGDDEDHFFISTDNKLYLKTALDFGATTSYSLTITATAKDDSTVTFTTDPITLIVTDVDEVPTDITFAPASGVSQVTGGFEIAEDASTVAVSVGSTTEQYYLIGDITVDDPDTITAANVADFANMLSLTGTDFTTIPFFDTDGTYKHKLYLTTALDFETTTSYSLTITTGTVSVAINLGVMNVNEAPVFNDGSSAKAVFNRVVDNVADAFYTATASDEDRGDTLIYSITSVLDSADMDIIGSNYFVVDPSSGALSFASATIANNLADGAYTVEITVSDGSLEDAITVDVRVISGLYSVTGQIDPPDMPADDAVTQNIAISALTGTGTFGNAFGSDPVTTLTFGVLPRGVTLSYDDGTGVDTPIGGTEFTIGTVTNIKISVASTAIAGSKEIIFTASDGTVNVDAILDFTINNPPEITPASVDVTIGENNVDTYTVVADDADIDTAASQTLSYSVSGVDAGFFDISSAGVITFKSAPNFEAPRGVASSTDNVYRFTVTVTDTLGSTATQAVTIEVTDVDEAPTVTLTASGDPRVTGTGGVFAIVKSTAAADSVIGGVAGMSYYLIGDIAVDDPDADGSGFANNALTVSDTDNFLISDDKLYLALSSPLNYVPAGTNSYEFTITANEGNTALEASRAIILSVADIPPDENYVWTRGDGNITISEVAYDGADKLRLNGVNIANVTFARNPVSGDPFTTADITITIDGGASIVLSYEQYDSNGDGTTGGADEYYQGVKSVHFDTDGNNMVDTGELVLNLVYKRKFAGDGDNAPATVIADTTVTTTGSVSTDLIIGFNIEGEKDATSTYYVRDYIRAGDDRDYVYGLAGDDIIYGEGGHDRLYGGAGSDRIYGGTGLNVLYGGDGNDMLYGGDHSDGLLGGDTIWGGEGDDYIEGGSNGGHIYGGAGNDVIKGSDSTGLDVDEIWGQAGNDNIESGAGDDTLNGGAGRDEIKGGAGHDTLNGGADNDRLEGGADNDTLYGGAGNDALYGQAGHDVLYGGAGRDILEGGAGNDKFFFSEGDGNDQIIEKALLTIMHPDGVIEVLDGGVSDTLILTYFSATATATTANDVQSFKRVDNLGRVDADGSYLKLTFTNTGDSVTLKDSLNNAEIGVDEIHFDTNGNGIVDGGETVWLDENFASLLT